MPIDETISEDLKAKHGDVLELETDWGDAAFRVATPGEWQRFNDEIADESTRPRALRTLVIACCVYPPRDEFEKLLTKRPGLTQGFGNQLTKHCGLGNEAVRKKS
jgi:hypothetical protein